MATQKGCSYAEKKAIRESHVSCERSGAAVNSDVPGHKMTPADALMRLQESLALNQSRRFPAKRGKANSIAFYCDNRNSCEGQPRKPCLAQS
jgi:hypothetical protein